MTKYFLRFKKVNKMASGDLIYRQLQKVLDERLPVGFPATDSGIEIRVLKHLFTPEEAEIAIHLTNASESLIEIHERVIQSVLEREGIRIGHSTIYRILKRNKLISMIAAVFNGCRFLYAIQKF